MEVSRLVDRLSMQGDYCDAAPLGVICTQCSRARVSLINAQSKPDPPDLQVQFSV